MLLLCLFEGFPSISCWISAGGPTEETQGSVQKEYVGPVESKPVDSG